MKRVIVAAIVLASIFSSTFASATIIGSSTDSALSGANIINFDSVAQGTYQNFNTLSIGNVTFTGNFSVVNGGAFFMPHYDNSWLVTSLFSISPTGTSFGRTGSFLLTMDFANIINAFGFQYNFLLGGEFGSRNWKITAYDSSGNTLETEDLIQAGTSFPLPDRNFFGISHENISRVELGVLDDLSGLPSDAYETFGMDKLMVAQQQPVPEPSTLLLLGVGLLGLWIYATKMASPRNHSVAN